MSSPLSHLHDHKFKQNFPDTLNQLCICGKTLKQHLITFSAITISSMKEAPIKEIDPTNLTKSDSCITNILLVENTCLLQK